MYVDHHNVCGPVSVEKYEDYQNIAQRLLKGDAEFLETLLKDHASKKKTLASLRSR